MDRRDFTRTAIFGALGAGALTACSDNTGDETTSPSEDATGGPSVITGPSVRWRLASSFSRSLDTIYGAAEFLAERVGELTEGKFDIRCYPGGELIPSLEVLSNVQTGTVQMGHAASYYFIGKNPALAFDATVPFGLTAQIGRASCRERVFPVV